MRNPHCPIIVNSFNQYTYLQNMLTQLFARKYHNVIVLDQASVYPKLLDFLAEIERAVTVIRLPENRGPHWFFTSGFALKLPRHFIYTDPDIYFTPMMPGDFIPELIDIAGRLTAGKLGLALRVSNPDDMIRARFTIAGTEYSLADWEGQFWRDRVAISDHEIYRAPVDTTFALYDRDILDPTLRTIHAEKVFDCMSTPDSYRIAGPYESIHAPWMKDNLVPAEEWDFYTAHRSLIHQY